MQTRRHATENAKPIADAFFQIFFSVNSMYFPKVWIYFMSLVSTMTFVISPMYMV